MNRATGPEASGWRLGLPNPVACPASSGCTRASPRDGAATKGTQPRARRRSRAGLLFRARSPDGLEISGKLRRSWLSARSAESRVDAAQAHEQDERTASGVAAGWHDGQPDRSEEAGLRAVFSRTARPATRRMLRQPFSPQWGAGRFRLRPGFHHARIAEW
jgi:hypothetical protein